MKCFYIFSIIFLLYNYISYISSTYTSLTDKWLSYKIKHRKSFSLNEESERFKIFNENVLKIKKQNNNYSKGKSKYYTGINQLTDMLKDEIKNLNGFIPPQSKPLATKRLISTARYSFGANRPGFKIYYSDPGTILPNYVNWSESGWSEPVWTQGKCGACWAFSTSSVISAQVWIKYKLNITLSSQDFIDCSRYLSTYGCKGGSQANALEYSVLNGTSLFHAYPYKEAEQTCDLNKRNSSPILKIKTFFQINPDHDSLKQALALLGPVTTSVDAREGFYSYQGGIYDGISPDNSSILECSPNGINHAVTIVGYGTDNVTKNDYWLIKNSWGTSWGYKLINY